MYFPHPLVQDLIWDTLYVCVEPLLTRWPLNTLVREKALQLAMKHLHYEDENRHYITIGCVEKVHMLVDNLDIGDVNSVNKRAAISAALLLLPSKFTEEDLYAKICSLSYMGDLRMFFAEDTNKVNNIVKGQFGLFQSMYKPFLEECETKDLPRFC